MVPYRKDRLKGEWFKFVLNRMNYSFEHLKAAEQYCRDELSLDGWSLFNGGNYIDHPHGYYLFLIREEDEATLFRLRFIHGKGIRGIVKF